MEGVSGKHLARIVLNSGFSFTVLCDNLTVKSFENQLTSYSFEGIVGSNPFYIRIDDIAAVIDEGEIVSEESP